MNASSGARSMSNEKKKKRKKVNVASIGGEDAI